MWFVGLAEVVGTVLLVGIAIVVAVMIGLGGWFGYEIIRACLKK